MLPSSEEARCDEYGARLSKKKPLKKGWRCREGAPDISGEVRHSGFAPEIRRGSEILSSGENFIALLARSLLN